MLSLANTLGPRDEGIRGGVRGESVFDRWSLT